MLGGCELKARDWGAGGWELGSWGTGCQKARGLGTQGPGGKDGGAGAQCRHGSVQPQARFLVLLQPHSLSPVA